MERKERRSEDEWMDFITLTRPMTRWPLAWAGLRLSSFSSPQRIDDDDDDDDEAQQKIKSTMAQTMLPRMMLPRRLCKLCGVIISDIGSICSDTIMLLGLEPHTKQTSPTPRLVGSLVQSIEAHRTRTTQAPACRTTTFPSLGRVSFLSAKTTHR